MTIPEVERAKVLMNEARSWSVVRWLAEKKKVRRAADAANAKLDAVHAELKSKWPPELRRAYDALVKNGKSSDAEADLAHHAQLLYAMDREAQSARAQAEATFDDAEKKLSAALARQGCAEAIRSWELHERANARAEAAGQRP